MTLLDANRRLAESRQIFQRVLAQWASDLLALQASGQRQPTWDRRHPSAPAAHESSTTTRNRRAA